MRVVISTLFFLIGSAAYSQLNSRHLQMVDSIENAVNSGIKRYMVKKDTGHIVISATKNQSASYKKQFYIDPKTNSLDMVTYLRMFNSGVLINETYYYVHNKPISAYIYKQAKRKMIPEEAYYFYMEQTYKHNDSTILKPNNEIISKAEGFLKEYKKIK